MSTGWPDSVHHSIASRIVALSLNHPSSKRSTGSQEPSGSARWRIIPRRTVKLSAYTEHLRLALWLKVLHRPGMITCPSSSCTFSCRIIPSLSRALSCTVSSIPSSCSSSKFITLASCCLVDQNLSSTYRVSAGPVSLFWRLPYSSKFLQTCFGILPCGLYWNHPPFVRIDSQCTLLWRAIP